MERFRIEALTFSRDRARAAVDDEHAPLALVVAVDHDHVERRARRLERGRQLREARRRARVPLGVRLGAGLAARELLLQARAVALALAELLRGLDGAGEGGRDDPARADGESHDEPPKLLVKKASLWLLSH